VIEGHDWPLWAWVGFLLYVLIMLVISLLAHRGQRAVSLRSAAAWSVFWIAAGLAVNIFVWWLAGPQAGLQFFTGYLLEESLSVDNLFVILTIFTYFGIPPARQHRVLFWGILGAIVFRGIFILAGTALVERFHWVLYLFGLFLVVTGARMGLKEETDVDPDQNFFVRVFRRLVPVCTEIGTDHFFIRLYGRLCATPMLVALVVVETSDVMFAVDSIPAVFSVTTDPFIVFASNICAVLGLRSLYFLLQGVMGLFRFLRYGLAIILMFVGAKMLIADFFHIPIGVSLGVVAGVLAFSVLASLLFRKKLEGAEDLPAPSGDEPKSEGTGDST
jgi:tellurite resistance protein TerC